MKKREVIKIIIVDSGTNSNHAHSVTAVHRIKLNRNKGNNIFCRLSKSSKHFWQHMKWMSNWYAPFSRYFNGKCVNRCFFRVIMYCLQLHICYYSLCIHVLACNARTHKWCVFILLRSVTRYLKDLPLTWPACLKGSNEARSFWHTMHFSFI